MFVTFILVSVIALSHTGVFFCFFLFVGSYDSRFFLLFLSSIKLLFLHCFFFSVSGFFFFVRRPRLFSLLDVFTLFHPSFVFSPFSINSSRVWFRYGVPRSHIFIYIDVHSLSPSGLFVQKEKKGNFSFFFGPLSFLCYIYLFL
ncbi:hypothetical protein, unlikely [Trypanosoma brucei gambiense DAL972]|uniref:Uncharacterized protein n=1 Tax=Trypanosoma brucei gambiense (strain MHOM/CI/86/DAL972) TaxID=679716 RepID=D0A679_TRYB9|nr:hypothetical protein, unlikely [Trypanosoma brucei gambiense DAL972]CBH17180.1 hypothetical protein, unlikely [Trypanosoma brucei gambiense DAL972]|eukprot:XP_011779444.1 hypothetical protein, unlikely [Trypanosoma brucei gambiense DAL972]